MRVSDSSNAYTMINSMTDLKSTQNTLTQELTSGKRVRKLQDDPSLAYSILNSQVSREQLIQYNSNLSLCSNIAKAGTDNLSYIKKEIGLAADVAESAQSVTSKDTATIASYSSEVDGITNEVLSMANSKYGDDYLFAGSASGSSKAPYSLQYPIEAQLSSAISAAKSATTNGSKFDNNTTTAAATIGTQISDALTSLNATDSSGKTTYDGTFSLSNGSYVFSGTATDATKAVCAALDSMKTLQSAVSGGSSVGTTISDLSSAGDNLSDYGKYVYSGSGEGRSIQVSDGVSISPFAGSDASSTILNTLNSLLDLKNAIKSGDTTAIASAASTLSKAEDSVVDVSSDLSTATSRLTLLGNRNTSTYTNLDDAEETSTKASQEDTTVRLLAAQQAYSAALQGTSLLLSKSILDYL